MRIIFYFLLLISHSAFAVTECGVSKDDRRFPDLDWIKATEYEVNSVYIDIFGLICIGMDSKRNTISRLHYRDDSGVNVSADRVSLIKKNVTLLTQSDFPRVARLVTRNVDPLTIKIINEKIESNYTDYTISLKFVRNMGKGFSSTDLRELVVKARFFKNGKNEVYYESNLGSKSLFDLVSLNVGGDLVVGKIKFFDGQVLVDTIHTLNLSKTKR